MEKNAIEMYLTHNEVKSVVAETLKNRIYKYMTSISKNVYIDKCVYMLLVILMEGKLLERITKKSCKKQIEKSLELRK